MTRFRATTLSIQQEEESSTSKSPSYFSNLEQVIRKTIKAIQTNIAKSLRFDFFIEEFSFQNPKVEHEPSINSNKHSWKDLKIF